MENTTIHTPNRRHPARSAAGLFLAALVLLATPFPAEAKKTKAWMDPLSQTKFVNPLPNPLAPSFVLRPDTRRYPGNDYYEVSMKQFTQDLGLKRPDGEALYTKVWGYGDKENTPGHSFPGPTIVARRGRPVKVWWVNDLPDKHLLPVDDSVHCGPKKVLPNGKLVPSNCKPEVRAVAHLHGGHVDAHSDGYPEAWFSNGWEKVGPLWEREVYEYRNDQEAATLWYHDHAMGITRLNVYAGLAAFYILRDENEEALTAAGYLPGYPYEVPLVIQDRSFYEDGSLAYPTEADPPPLDVDPETGEPYRRPVPSPSGVAEFFGDFILVNGQVWPVMKVEPRKYRLRFLNGSNARFYNMSFSDRRLRFDQIGSDGGFMKRRVRQRELLMAPAERADVIVDFSHPKLWGKTIYLANDANQPFPDGDPVDPETAGQIMAFEVSVPLDDSVPDTLAIPGNMDINEIPRLRPRHAGFERELILVENFDEYGRLQPLLGTLNDGPQLWSAPITENPMVNDTEIWTVVNTTEDTHPVHLHLVQFQILDRQPFDLEYYEQTGMVYPLGESMRPDRNERGWKDTVRANPAEITRVIATFDLPGLFVWHCHILEHEDHEMMRPFYVGPIPAGNYPQ